MDNEKKKIMCSILLIWERMMDLFINFYLITIN